MSSVRRQTLIMDQEIAETVPVGTHAMPLTLLKDSPTRPTYVDDAHSSELNRRMIHGHILGTYEVR